MPHKTLRLILGDQLNEQHSWFQRPERHVSYIMMEVRQETDYVKHHIQKVAAFFAAMRAFADRLSTRGHRVLYLRLDDPENRQSFEDNLRRVIREHGFTGFEYLRPDEYRLDRQLEQVAERLNLPWSVSGTEHFLTHREDVAAQFAGEKRYLMESFYRRMRKTFDILIENGKPVGGKWNYDVKNRKPYDGKVPIPAPEVFGNDVSDIVEIIEAAGVTTFGNIQPEQFIWPIDRTQSQALLMTFLEQGLPHFGTYQDAMISQSWSLFHSRLSFSLNTKMLRPLEVIRGALAEWERRDEIDIQQVEGFIRQILGWREYMRGVYWDMMPNFADMNFFNHNAPLPAFYWTGDTHMACLKAAIDQSLDHAYAHHIQRLMVTGNFALLAGVHPDAVDKWYLGIYIDAIEWVEKPNTRGMSQFADGGRIATKPYVSSARYIHSMSDYCRHCHYRHKEKLGDRACPFNSLYWDFFARHRDRLDSNPRIGMMYRTWDRMKDKERILDRAGALKNRIHRL